MVARLISIAALILTVAVAARADATLLGVATLPGTATDLSGLTEKQSDGTPQNRLGGLGS